MSDAALAMMQKKAERKMFILRKAVAFARANLDDMNEALGFGDDDYAKLGEPISDDEMDAIQLLVEQDNAIPIIGLDELAEAEKEIRAAQRLAEDTLRTETKDEE